MASEKGPPGKGKGKAKDALLFLDVSNASEDSKASNRKKARAHIMNQYHRKHRNAPVRQQLEKSNKIKFSEQN